MIFIVPTDARWIYIYIYIYTYIWVYIYRYSRVLMSCQLTHGGKNVMQISRHFQVEQLHLTCRLLPVTVGGALHPVVSVDQQSRYRVATASRGHKHPSHW